MQSRYQAIRGTYDILPGETELWQKMEQTAREVFRHYCFREIRTPVFESTELFTRSIGQGTDIVSKEMYTFLDKKGRSCTLRPEATACVIRALVEHSELLLQALPQKLYYIGPMFRYEKPQSGRNRQFHQIGVEAIGSYQPGMDAEAIALVVALMAAFGLNDVRTEVNSVGCAACRPEYTQRLEGYLEERRGDFCEDCRDRTDKNPLRVFDCKIESCKTHLKQAPLLMTSLCATCKTHFEQVRGFLSAMKVPYKVNERLVRGIDYYTRTTFELRHHALGAQDAIAAGGRYDTLVEELGGPPTGAVGFALGMERVAMALKNAQNVPARATVNAFLVSLGAQAYEANLRLCGILRAKGLVAELDHEGRSLKAQMRHADRLGSEFVLIRGDNELKNGLVQMKDMKTGAGQVVKEADVVDRIINESNHG